MNIGSKNKSAVASLILGLLGWTFYLVQWCFDLTLGIFLAAMTGGMNAIISTVFDFLPFVLWVAGLVTGHLALKQSKREGRPGRNMAVWGLVVNYLGLFFSLIFLILIVNLIFAGIGVGLFKNIIPFIHK
jgi:hypothetical protein